MTIEGKIVNIEGVKRGRIEINEATGLISKIASATGQVDLVFKDELIFPGFVDVHVHAREDVSHTQDYKEDFQSASEAAINGGVVAIADMPNNPVPPVDEKSYADKKALTAKSKIEIVLYAGIGTNTRPLSFPVPYKVFMGPSVGDLFFKSKEDLDNTLKHYQKQSVSFHCEDPEVLEKFKNQPTHELRRPKEAEIFAIEFALKLIEKYQLQGKICHLSTKKGLAKIIEAKRQGVNVVCEVAPHHLYFDNTVIASVAKQSLSEEKIASSDALLAMTKWLEVNPPTREPADRLALLEALKNGEIDFLATDHAPHIKKEKSAGASGLPHLDTYGLFVCWLMKEHKFSAQDVARVCSFNPGNFLNQFTSVKYGKIAQGFVGSLTVIDLNQETVVRKANLKTKCGWSPFEGVKFSGKVVATLIKGKVYKVN